MTHSEQVKALSNDIDSLIDRYADEFDLSYAAIIGVLFSKAHFLCQEAAEIKDEEGEDEESKKEIFINRCSCGGEAKLFIFKNGDQTIECPSCNKTKTITENFLFDGVESMSYFLTSEWNRENSN
jgi:hypothetical protein